MRGSSPRMTLEFGLIPQHRNHGYVADGAAGWKTSASPSMQ
jgi:hypothetical protein